MSWKMGLKTQILPDLQGFYANLCKSWVLILRRCCVCGSAKGGTPKEGLQDTQRVKLEATLAWREGQKSLFVQPGKTPHVWLAPRCQQGFLCWWHSEMSRFHTDFQAHSTSAALDHQSLFPNLMPSFHSGLLSCRSCSHRGDSKPFYTAPLHLHSSATEQNGSWAVIKFLGIAGRCNVLIKKVIAPPLFLQVWLITWRFHSPVLTPSKGSPHHLLIFN